MRSDLMLTMPTFKGEVEKPLNCLQLGRKAARTQAEKDEQAKALNLRIAKRKD